MKSTPSIGSGFFFGDAASIQYEPAGKSRGSYLFWIEAV